MTAVDFVMPSLGSDMDEGTVTEWLVGVGDAVERGDIVAIVETDKADIDVEVWQGGIVSEILVQPGRPVAVGTPLARLTVPAGDEPAPSPPRARRVVTPAPGPSDAESPLVATPVPGPSDAESPPVAAPAPSRPPPLTPASPLARRLAAERRIDLTAVAGTGPSGAVVARDLPTTGPDGDGRSPGEAGQPPPREAAGDRMRRRIAELMTRSNRDIPHYHLAAEIDVEAMVTALEARNADRPVDQRIVPAAGLLHGIARAVADNRELNGFWLDDRFVPGDGVHLGVAVSLRSGGLVAPAIHDVDQLDLDDLMGRLRDLVGRARTGRLRASELSGATITVTNLGDRGVDLVHGIIHPPQVALVGLGRIVRRPAVVGDDVVARRLVTATLAADHRASDGQRGARFLAGLARHLTSGFDPAEPERRTDE